MKKTAYTLLAVLTAFLLLSGSIACALEGLQETDDNFFVHTDP